MMTDAEGSIVGGAEDASGRRRGSADPAGRQRPLERPRGIGDLATQFLLPAGALALAAFAGWFVWSTRPVEVSAPPPSAPPRSPYRRTLSCSGIIEPQSESISVGSASAGVVVEVAVRVGEHVEAGTPLFRLDDRDLRGARAVCEASLSQAKSELIRLEAEPRRETIPPLVAAVSEKRAAEIAATDAARRAEELFAQGVITEQDMIDKREAADFASAAVEKAKAELALREAGSWSYDRDVARAAVLKAEADLRRIEIDLDRLTVRALVPAEVLQLNVRPGEFVGAPPGQPLVVLGDVDRLRVRVDIDEFEIARFDRDAAAQATPRGVPGDVHPLRFVRVEPFVVPKRSLTGDTSERVDTRVLQVIYELDPAGDGAARPLFVGQQVEVSIEAGGEGEAPGGDRGGEEAQEAGGVGEAGKNGGR